VFQLEKIRPILVKVLFGIVKDISYVAFILEGGVPEVAPFPSKATVYVTGVHFA
jgi:hypothetical protein